MEYQFCKVKSVLDTWLCNTVSVLNATSTVQLNMVQMVNFMYFSQLKNKNG